MNALPDDAALRSLLPRLADDPRAAVPAVASEPSDRQPVHTVYGGAHRFTCDVAAKLGAAARRALAADAPDFVTFARAVGMPGAEKLPAVPAERARFESRMAAEPAAVRRSEPHAWLAHETWTRLQRTLATAPVEDYRIDFEDGYGPRPDAEEDAHADAVGAALARGLAEGTLPPMTGIRVRALTASRGGRALRTLERVLAALLPATRGALPAHFVVTVPKVTQPSQVALLADALEALESRHALPAGALRCELMLELPSALVAADGRIALPGLVEAARGRCRGVHFGAYDYTAALGVAAAHQGLEHPAAAFARAAIAAALAGTAVTWSDGAVTRLPLPVHRADAGGALTDAQQSANREAVHGAWREHYAAVRRALAEGCWQGWDLHPAQLPTRHAATIAFFLEGLEPAAERLRGFLAQSAQAVHSGGLVEDEATAQGLLNFFARGRACGALTDADLERAGVTPAELRERDFSRMVAARSAGRDQDPPANGPRRSVSGGGPSPRRARSSPR